MITLILCAAGSGKRAGLPDNKVFFELNGLPAISHSLSVFAPRVDEILVTCRKEDVQRMTALLSPYEKARIVLGGKSRAESVVNALREAKGDVVLVHDAARPFVTPKLVDECIECVMEHGSGVCAMKVTDTVVLADHDRIGSHIPREFLYTVQTPQGYLREKLLEAYRKAEWEGNLARFTDESGVYMEYMDYPYIFEGDPVNKKLTHPRDFCISERIGFGVDTHAFAHQEEIDRGIARLNLNHITLCGVTVPSSRALEAYSDGDVPVHALMDALLSAMGARDIGWYFPSTNPNYKDISSMILLGQVMNMVRAKSLAVKNVSISVLCEQPRLSPYIDAMRENLKTALCCENVGIAAGTNEGLGYVGEGRGITACAAVLLCASHDSAD